MSETGNFFPTLDEHLLQKHMGRVTVMLTQLGRGDIRESEAMQGVTIPIDDYVRLVQLAAKAVEMQVGEPRAPTLAELLDLPDGYDGQVTLNIQIVDTGQ